MELVILVVILILGGSLLGLAAFIMALGNSRQLGALQKIMKHLDLRLAALEGHVRQPRPAEAPVPPAKAPPAPEAPEAAPAPPVLAAAVAPPPEPAPAAIVSEAVAPVAAAPPAVPEAAAPPPAAPQAAPPAPPPPPAPQPPREPLPASAPSLEEVVGTRWMTWVGIVLLFLGVSFFLKYAIDNQWLGPTGRVLLGFLAGIVMLVYGDRFVRRSMRTLGQGLMGGGLAVLYASLYAAFAFYGLLPQAGAFVFMVAITALGMTLAMAHDSPSLAVLAVLGGFLTPVMVSTGKDARDELFCYLILLNLGVLGAALFKKWRALELLSFIGTWFLYGGWYARHYDGAALVPALAWALGFYAAFLAVPFAWHFRTATAITTDRFMAAMANAVVFFSYAWSMLYADQRFVLGFVALAMSACYVVLGSFTRRRIPEDRTSLFGFVALGVVFLTMAIPLHLSLHGITLAWAVEGPALLYLGFRFRYPPARVFGFLVMVLATLRLFLFNWPLHRESFTPFANTEFLGAMFIVAAAAAFTVIHRLWADEGDRVDGSMRVAGAVGAGLLCITLFSGELGQWLDFSRQPYLADCASVYLWAAGALIFLAAGVVRRSLAYRIAGEAALIVCGFNALVMGGPPHYPDYLLAAEPGFFARLAALLAVFAYAYVLRRYRAVCREDEATISVFFDISAVFGLLCLLSDRSYNCGFLQGSPRGAGGWFAQMALSVTWSVYAVALLIVGLWRRVRWLRVSALCLFLFTAGKVVLVDMAHLQEVYRIVSFLVLGFLMIEAAYLYHRLEKRIGLKIGRVPDE